MTATLASSPPASTSSSALWRIFPSPLGWMGLTYSADHLLGVAFGHASPQEVQRALQQRLPDFHGDSDPAGPGWACQLEDQLLAMANGHPQDFSEVPLDTSHLTPLGQQILNACSHIPWGEMRSYQQLAHLVGRPKAARAVGNVMANNRFPLVVPCHRVVGSAGSLGGYSAPGGLDTKRKLLAMEGSLLVG